MSDKMKMNMYEYTFMSLVYSLKVLYQNCLTVTDKRMKLHELDCLERALKRNEELREEYLQLMNISSRFRANQEIAKMFDKINKLKKKVKSRIKKQKENLIKDTTEYEDLY